jgi:uncharacterized cupin superfamily protein
MTDQPPAILAMEAPPRLKASNYPPPFAALMAGRVKRPLGDLFGIKSFGVNLTHLAPGAISALHHVHSRQDEFIYVIEGEPTLISDSTQILLGPGMVAGFSANGRAHHLENRSLKDCYILEIGDRAPDDTAIYPADDLQAVLVDGNWTFSHKDGHPYQV